MFKKKEKEVIRLDSSVECIRLINEAQENSDDLIEQLVYVEKQKANLQDKMLAKITLIQVTYATFSINNNDVVEIPVSTVEYFLRAILDMGRHMQQDLPNGVYDYIDSNSSSFFKRIVDKTKQ